MDGAAIGQTNRWRLNPPKSLPLVRHLNPRRSDRSFDRARNMDILRRDAAFDMTACQHMNDLTDDLALDATGHLKVVPLKGALNGGLGVDNCTIQGGTLKGEAIDPVIC